MKKTEGLKNRHISMIALGGAIGAGLFVGSGSAIASAGPSVILGFLFVGLLVVSVMRMLGEIVTADPGRGSFIEYLRMVFGDRVGFTTGWLYWFFWVVVMGSEAIAGAILIKPIVNIPIWEISISLIICINAINFCAPRIFGECEFWLSGIKVFSIIIFVICALLYILGFIGEGASPIDNLLNHNGIFPNGVLAMFSLMPTILFTMMGSEIATVAAAESEEPAKNIARVTRGIGVRITVFYVCSITTILLCVPWTNISSGISPFLIALNKIGVPYAGKLMQISILSAVLSCLNSSMYITSRTLTELSDKGDAPNFLKRASYAQSPKMAILFSSLAGIAVAFTSIISPETAFAFLLSCSGGVMILVYMMIVIAYLILKPNFCKKTGYNKIVAYTSFLYMVAIVVCMIIDKNERNTIFATFLTALLCFFISIFYKKNIQSSI